MIGNHAKELTKRELEVIYNVKFLYNKKVSESNLLLNHLNKKGNISNDDKNLMIIRICSYIRVNNDFNKCMNILKTFSKNTNQFYIEIKKRANQKFDGIEQQISKTGVY
jgi:uncharacterized membrane protein YqiK